MRILQVLHNHKIGGAEQHLIQLCEGLRNRGHVVEVAAAKESWIGCRLSEAKFMVHEFDPTSHFDPVTFIRFTNLLFNHKFDVVHTHLVRAAYYGRLATRLTNTPLVSTVHDLTTWKHYPRERNVIAVSDAVRKHLISRGFTDSRIHVVFAGARDCSLGVKNGDVRKRIREELGLQSDEFAIFLIGRVAEVKGHDIALKAIKLVKEKYGPSAKLFFAGQETAWASTLRESDEGIAANWLGRREDVPELLSAADLCIQPSRSEGLSISLMEAASAAKATIGSRVGGIPEVIENEVTGLLVPPENPIALADAIMRLLNAPEKIDSLANASRNKFEDQFSIDHMVEKTLAVYEKCITLDSRRFAENMPEELDSKLESGVAETNI